jgi:hypothetical protein
MRLHRVTLGLVLLLALAPVDRASAVAQWRWPQPERIVTIGDVHGAWDELVLILRETNLVDENLAWAGGKAHLVSLGDLVDRGPRSRDVLDLMMRLQTEAAVAGGAVHVLLGNHEAMLVSGELDYTVADDFAAFADEETNGQRSKAYQAWLKANGREPSGKARSEFKKNFPRGYFAHRAAFAPEGRYGRWILERPVIAVLGDTAFTHGGATDQMGGLQPEALATWLPDDLEQYARARNRLIAAGLLPPRIGLQEGVEAAMPLQREGDDELRDAAGTLIAAAQSPVFSADGPLWYRGTAWCHPYTEVFRVQTVLDNLDARRLVIGHTPTPDARIHERMRGRVVMVDTGMLKAAYQGRPSALIIERGELSAVYPNEAPAPVEPLPRRVGPRPGLMTDGEVETFLSEATVVSQERLLEGVTRPQRVTLERNGVTLTAIFKTESVGPVAGRGRVRDRAADQSDRWQYEVAAYRLDRLLELDLVPVTVERTINGREGSLQLWVGETVSELDRQEKDLVAQGWCTLSEQWSLMYAFDALVHNVDRSLQNIRYDAETWMLYLVDHSRTFRLGQDRPADLRGVEIRISTDFAERLAALDANALFEHLGEYVTRSQIRSVLQRRDRMLRDWGPPAEALGRAGAR